MIHFNIFVCTCFILILVSTLCTGEESSIDTSTSQRLSQISNANFLLVTGNLPGCVEEISHAAIGNTHTSASTDVSGIIPLAEIFTNGAPCTSETLEEVVRLYSSAFYSEQLPEYLLNLPQETIQSIFAIGKDTAVRKCGTWEDDQTRVYLFSEDFETLLSGLSMAAILDDSLFRYEKVVQNQMWMISASQSGDGRICAYVRTSEELEDDGAMPSVSQLPGDDFESLEESTEEGIETGNPGVFEAAYLETVEEDTANSIKNKKCFPRSARVVVEGGASKSMKDLRIGDRVLVAPGVFSPVILFSHRVSKGTFAFLRIALESGDSLTTTAGHYIYVNGDLRVAALNMRGDTLELANGSRSAIIGVKKISEVGLYNPQTMDGDIIVDGVRCSTYTSALAPGTAHGLLAPIRALVRADEGIFYILKYVIETLQKVIYDDR